MHFWFDKLSIWIDKQDFCRDIEEAIDKETTFKYNGKEIKLEFYGDIDIDIDIDKEHYTYIRVKSNVDCIDYIDNYFNISEDTYINNFHICFPHDRSSMICFDKITTTDISTNLIQHISIDEINKLMELKAELVNQGRIYPQYSYTDRLDISTNF